MTDIFSATVSGTSADGLFHQKGSNVVPSACNENLLVRFLDADFNSSVDGVADIWELEENLMDYTV